MAAGLAETTIQQSNPGNRFRVPEGPRALGEERGRLLSRLLGRSGRCPLRGDEKPPLFQDSAIYVFLFDVKATFSEVLLCFTDIF